MEERNIKISLEKAKEWYKQGGDLKEVALQAFSEGELTEQFPKSWEEYLGMNALERAVGIKILRNDNLINANKVSDSIYYCHFKSEAEAEAFVALGKLIQLRDEYWKLDNNWEPDWNDNKDKFSIYTDFGNVHRFICRSSHVLAFRTSELRDKFYNNFNNLIEEAKMFL